MSLTSAELQRARRVCYDLVGVVRVTASGTGVSPSLNL